MVLQSSGTIKISDVKTEFQLANPVKFSSMYSLAAGFPSTGTMKLSSIRLFGNHFHKRAELHVLCKPILVKLHYARYFVFYVKRHAEFGRDYHYAGKHL